MSKDQDHELGSRHRGAEACEPDHERELAETMANAVLALIERFGSLREPKVCF